MGVPQGSILSVIFFSIKINSIAKVLQDDLPFFRACKQDKESENMIACSMSSSRERERNVLFNDALNTFYLRLYGVRHMVKDHSDSEKGNPLLPHRLLLSINSKGSFICTIPQTG